MPESKIFLLSPAHCGGKRAAVLLRPEAEFGLAMRLRSTGAPLGEVFAFLSGLYFRGKLAYAARFSAPPPGALGSLVITTNRGLLDPYMFVTPTDLAGFSGVSIDRNDARYLEPLAADAMRLAQSAPEDCRFILLGSIATAKYVDPLLSILGDRLCFPGAFAGMGDMQRGALLLRAVQEGTELPYVRAAGAIRTRARARVGGRP